MRVFFFDPEQYVSFENEPSNYELRLPIVNCGLVTEYRDFVYQSVLRREGSEAMNAAALREVQNFNPDLVVYSTSWPNETLSVNTLQQIMQQGVPLLTHVWDTHTTHLKHEIEWFSNCNYFAVADSVSNYLFYRYLARNKKYKWTQGVLFTGGNNVFTDVFARKQCERPYTVTMLGSNEAARAELIKQLRPALAARNIKLEKFGGLIDSFKKRPEFEANDHWIPFDAYVDVINRSKICLSSQTQTNRCQIKGKVFQFLACGAFCLTDFNPEIEKIIPAGCVAYYDGVEDCISKIVYYLEREEEREAIAERGYRWFHQTYNYKVFWSEVLRSIITKDAPLPELPLPEAVSAAMIADEFERLIETSDRVNQIVEELERVFGKLGLARLLQWRRKLNRAAQFLRLRRS